MSADYTEPARGPGSEMGQRAGAFSRSTFIAEGAHSLILNAASRTYGRALTVHVRPLVPQYLPLPNSPLPNSTSVGLCVAEMHGTGATWEGETGVRWQRVGPPYRRPPTRSDHSWGRSIRCRGAAPARSRSGPSVRRRWRRARSAPSHRVPGRALRSRRSAVRALPSR
jgi:hypothetical protein